MDRGELITDFGVPSSVGYYHLASIGDMADTSTTYTEAPSYQPIPGMGMGTARDIGKFGVLMTTSTTTLILGISDSPSRRTRKKTS